MVNITNINVNDNDSEIEENKKNILAINNFENVMKHNDNQLQSTISTEDLNTFSLNELIVSEDHHHNSEVTITNNEDSTQEVITEDDVEALHDENENPSPSQLLQGGIRNDNSHDENIIYNIDYILEDDEKLVNPETIYKNADIYIDNYKSIEIEKYKKNSKQLYQTYSNKNYTITTKKITTNINIKNNAKYKIIVTKNDKTNKIVKEMNKPTYLFYDEDNNLIKLKRDISNARTELLYKYEQIIAKLDIKPEDKKEFEKERSKFIEMLETYYTYVLYHKKINKIITINKFKLVLQKTMSVYNEKSEYENKREKE